MTTYNELRKVSVADKIEKKNGLSYLSWAFAVDVLLSHDPQATWEHGTPIMFGETMMVSCTVNAFGKRMTAQLPVMDHRNKCIPNPDAFAVNTAMQRCLVKAIALHGLGLYIYAGEDLPEDSPKVVSTAEKFGPQSAASFKQDTRKVNDAAKRLMEAGDNDSKLMSIWTEVTEDHDFATAVWMVIDKRVKDRINQLKKAAA